MKFKSCPFCGGEARFDFAHGSNQIYADKNGFAASTPILYMVFCENCSVRTPPCESVKIKDFIPTPYDNYWFKRKFCPNCGAKMEAE